MSVMLIYEDDKNHDCDDRNIRHCLPQMRHRILAAELGRYGMKFFKCADRVV